jgi:hypothetical protein
MIIKREEAEEKLHRVLCDDNGALDRAGISYRDRLLDCLEALGLIELIGEKWNAANWPKKVENV